MKNQDITYTKAIFPTSAFISYLLTCSLCLVLYLASFIILFRNKNKNDGSRGRCWDPLRYGITILLVLSWPIVADIVQLIDASI